ncbi:peptidylprolyl isomerase [Henriciella sp.]|uniref:peptidylprolyl isomerase n=1 Tax=Henriciella sp. TaxID=1968823 RepID=UPI0026386ED7|nr:peptidylprolyl isomerase [Henriciella sp.]
MIRFAAAALALVITSPALTTPVQAQEGETIEGIVAIVNDQPISYSDVRERASLLLLTLGAQRPTPEQQQQIASQALDELIDEKLQLQEAAEYEIEVSEEDINGAITDMARQSGLNREGLIGVLRQSGVDPQSLEAQMRAEIAWRRIMGGLYGSRIRISANQIDERLKRLQAASQETQYRLGEIFLYTANEEEKQQALQGAGTIIEQLKAGAPFEVAAQRFSSAPTSAAGGDMGLVALDDIDPAIAEVVRGMSEPGLSEPIEVENGVYIIDYRGRRDPSESVPVVNMVRLAVGNGSEDDLLAATAAAEDCEGAIEIAENDPNLNASNLDDVKLDDLGPEGRSMIETIDVGQHTDVMAMGDSLGVMYLCSRDESGSTLPSRDDIENQLYTRQLGMISQRELRDLRREATIIQRGS